MLLFVKAAESVEHVAGNDVGSGERPFHIAYRRAEIAAADARGHCDHAFEIVAHDLGLAADRDERGHAFERKQMAVGRTQKEIVDVAHGFARVSRNPNADADQLRPLLNMGGHVAGQEISKRFGDRL